MMRASFVVVAVAISAVPSLADDSVHLAMSNRIGLITYCEAKGLLTQEAAKIATARVARVRDATPEAVRATPEASAKREEAGRQGKWGTRGLSIETFAPTIGLTVAEFCKEQAE